ncbi:hypothetical protein QVD17_37170 [Tagetes erecta]|uniref:Mannitol dehydrogenase n=1 Tax=Tagetes erecta TaxID=13708 RepID=A0AAD8JVG0_TARER|nr:hypothetical protein QVD17_37170 [Tagetes erecta]
MATSPELEHPIKAYGYAAHDTSGKFSPLTFSRRATGEKDVRFKVLYCGICHSDLHFVQDEWGVTKYPVIPGKDEQQMQAVRGTLDGIIDTVSGDHPMAPLLNTLAPHGKLVLVGIPQKPLEIAAFSLIMGRKLVAGSNIGGIKETQEMLDFAAKNGITSDIEIIPIDYVNTAMERLKKSDVRYRFVIDVANSIKAE